MIFEKIREKLKKAESVKCYGSRNSGNYMIPLADAINIINQVEAEYNNGWISVDDRLPEIATIYLVTEEVILNSKKLYVVDIRLFGTDDEWLCPSNRKIIAWQPLPKPYVAIAKNATTIKDSIMNHFMKGE